MRPNTMKDSNKSNFLQSTPEWKIRHVRPWQPLLVTLVLFLFAVTKARADHALRADGRMLFNVMVPDGSTTGGGQMVRIRTTTLSFEFDPRTNLVTPLPKFSVIKRLADYVSTSQTLGREEASNLAKGRQWVRYMPPPRPVLVAPSPAPKVTPTPVNYVPPPPVARIVVSDTIPLGQRLESQLNIFMNEQSKMSQDAVTSVVQGVISPDQSRQAKIGLLERQKGILEQYFPQSETVKTAIGYWSKQLDRVRQTGRFDLEDL